MKDKSSEEFKAIETGDLAPQEKALAYTYDFKDFVEEQKEKHPHLLREVMEKINSLSRVGEKYSQDGVGVEFINKKDDRAFYKVSIETEKGLEEFFVKKAPTYLNNSGKKREFELGYEEFLGSVSVKEKLKNLSYVEIVQYELGYRDSNNTYFVSRWNKNLTTNLASYMDELQSFVNKDPDLYIGKELELQTLYGKEREIIDALGEEYKGRDIFSVNMAYNPKTGKIILFDLSLPHPTKRD